MLRSAGGKSSPTKTPAQRSQRAPRPARVDVVDFLQRIIRVEQRGVGVEGVHRVEEEPLAQVALQHLVRPEGRVAQRARTTARNGRTQVLAQLLLARVALLEDIAQALLSPLQPLLRALVLLPIRRCRCESLLDEGHGAWHGAWSHPAAALVLRQRRERSLYALLLRRSRSLLLALANRRSLAADRDLPPPHDLSLATRCHHDLRFEHPSSVPRSLPRFEAAEGVALRGRFRGVTRAGRRRSPRDGEPTATITAGAYVKWRVAALHVCVACVQ